MANQLYPQARQKFLTGAIDWTSLSLKLVLLSADYVFSSAHTALSDIDAGYRLATGVVATPTASDGVAQGQPAYFPALTTVDPITQAVLYVDSGVEATSDLIAFFDVVNGFPFTGDGSDVYLGPDYTLGGFFRV